MKDSGNSYLQAFLTKLVTVLVLLGICIFATTIGNKMSKNNEEKENKKEVEITEKATIDSLNEKVKYLNNIKEPMIVPESSSNLNYIYSKNLSNKDLSNKAKLTAVLLQLEKEDKFEDVNDDYYSSQYNGTSVSKIDFANVNKTYKNIFGTDISSKEDIEWSPSFVYNKERNEYYCLYVGNNKDDGSLSETYIYKYTESKNYAHVYIAYATVKMGEEDTFAIYKDYKGKNKYMEAAGFKFDEENYKEFSHYKITFRIFDDEYIFDNIEQL